MEKNIKKYKISHQLMLTGDKFLGFKF